jgi:hypothetical protein
MPHKHNADRRHHTLLRVLSRPKMSFKVRNWPACEAGLRRRGNLTLGPSIDWGIMNRAIRPVGYVAGWGFVDGMDATFGWDRD